VDTRDGALRPITVEPHDACDYRVRVRGTVYLWGSAGVTRDQVFSSPPILHIRNDTFGEPLSVSTQTAAATPIPIGTLQPGEGLSIALQGFSGVVASCSTASTMVACSLRSS
jgi:hypothetical protein